MGHGKRLEKNVGQKGESNTKDKVNQNATRIKAAMWDEKSKRMGNSNKKEMEA